MRQAYYGRQKFEIETTSDSLKARCNLPFGPKRNCAFFALIMIGFALWGVYTTWLSPDSLGHSNLWRVAHHYSVLDFSSVMIATAIFGLFLPIGIRLLCPAGAVLTCDRNQVTTTRIPWYSFIGRWATQTYNASEVSGFRLKFYGSGRSGNVYGIRFLVNGRRKSIFHGSIEPPEAYRILLGIKSLGLDVAPDPKLLSRVKAELLNRKDEELDRRMRI